ncbi:2-(1,2-epoxy-1,2-dihydrophenyl)acetyl-CoA isomerase [Sinirhodobacter ferrireducens]|uniref:2-(1,2-epoxy-1,2-dihydrophenyl)acetyl-CoA isomerase n=1 Tax=Paenirhodobacter ferrireducens TaxID=1215032 RepID=A0A443LPE7_9RHOB|nr:enoyl-CoA hydratase-related protein [Sinirhodobacter ferrireducens]RWR51034.1 2-(1,2-epoxy-1,2-dihydrophenyl)acetyl-CoA isomerase [Sinirhodobacter ferrireducens]
MSWQTIRYEFSEGLAVIAMNRPEVMNALNTTMRAELREALSRAAGEARAIVLTGAGRAFCSGQDLADGAATGVLELETVLREEYEPILKAITDCPVPVIAAVNGAAAGAGANLALAADVVIATESAVFLQAFTRIGLMPDAGGTYWLPRQVGLARAMGLALFADKVTATEAAAQGMIWEAVPDVDFAHHWRARAEHLAKGPTRAFAAVKRAMRESSANDLAAQLSLEAELQGGLGLTQDFREGVQAFLEKRPARFEGR